MSTNEFTQREVKMPLPVLPNPEQLETLADMLKEAYDRGYADGVAGVDPAPPVNGVLPPLVAIVAPPIAGAPEKPPGGLPDAPSQGLPGDKTT